MCPCKLTNVFVHIHTALSHLCMGMYKVTYTLTGRNTQAQAPEEQTRSLSSGFSILCTKPEVPLLSK